ncbi:cytochrome protein [Bisporella sp. PMI_857]|nr:cytochrome protein [Bisporella sp. PMI_857]
MLNTQSEQLRPGADSTVLLLLVGVVVWCIYGVIYNLFLSPLRTVPGPFLARFTRLWEANTVRTGNSHKDYVELHKKYGPIVRVAPNRYSFQRPEDMAKIYAIGRGWTKSNFYHAVGQPGIPNIFNMKDDQDHAKRKRKIASLYTMSTMVNYEPAVDEMNTVFLEKWHAFAKERKFINIPEFIQFYAIDVIGQITSGKNFDMMKNEKDVHGLLPIIKSMILYQGSIGLFPEWHSTIVKLSNLFQGTTAIAKIFDDQIDDQIADFREVVPSLVRKTNTKSEPFLQKLLELEKGSNADLTTLRDSVGANILAGSDTTAITVSAALFYLYRNLDKLVKLRQELKEATEKGLASDPITFAEANSLPYLQACIKETLRIHPAVGTILPRNPPKEGIQLGDWHFPTTADLGVNAWVAHYNPDIAGPEPEKFKPERWLDGEFPIDKKNAYFAFGGGSRVCLGKNISLLEMHKLVPQIVRYFDLQFEKPNEPMETFTTWFVWPEYNAYIMERNKST